MTVFYASLYVRLLDPPIWMSSPIKPASFLALLEFLDFCLSVIKFKPSKVTWPDFQKENSVAQNRVKWVSKWTNCKIFGHH